MKKEMTSKVLMATAMFIFGTLAPFVRNINVSSGELALYRAVLAAMLVGSTLLFTKQNLSIRNIKKEFVLLLLSGAAMGINWILLFEAYKYTTVSVATGKQILCFIMSTLGLVMITGTAFGGKHDLLGIAFGLGAAVFYATVMLLNKFIKGVTGLHRTFIQFLAAIIVLVPYVASTSGFTFASLNTSGWTNLLIVGLVHTGITYCMYFSSLKELPGQEVAILSYIDPLVAVLVSVIWLNEVITLPQVVGGLLILGFTLLCELPIGQKK